MILCGNPKAGYISYRQEIDSAISNVLNSGTYILGNEVKSFEEEFAQFTGTKYAVGVGSGTDALHLSLKAFNIGNGDEVITVSHTAVATVSAIIQCGATPVFVDIERDYFTMDPLKLEKAITKRTKAIIIVHIYGQPADLDPIIVTAKKYNIHLIEDCAQAHGAVYKNKKVGSIGEVGCFSFYPTKNLGGIGDGGMITTNDIDIYKQLKLLREYGWKERYISFFNGYNSRLDEIQAAVLRVKLKYLEKDNMKRGAIASQYYKGLEDLDLILPKIRDNVGHVYHLFVVRIKKRNELKDFLFQNEILSLIHYPVPVHLQNGYRYLPEFSLSVTEAAAQEILSLPMFPELSKHEIGYVIDMIRKFNSLS
jgi:dTDP-4-amino-4,6-dideoxygalactose transaminase